MIRPTPNAAYSLSIRFASPDAPGVMAAVAQAVACAGGAIAQIDLLEQQAGRLVREMVVNASGTDHAAEILDALRHCQHVEVLDSWDRTFRLHDGGKLEVKSRVPLASQADLSMAYTPGVGRVCMAIHDNPELGWTLTQRRNMVAIVTDGSAVLGLGDIGALAGLPVMEGKAILFKEFGGVDAFPICLDTKDTDEIVRIVKALAPTFGGVNLEDIAAPRCFEIEARLKKEIDIPVFHDDQHGTAVVSLAALENALALVGKEKGTIKLVMNGAGAAGIACAKLMQAAGVVDITLVDSKGIVSKDRADCNAEKLAFAKDKGGSLADACVGADVFVGVSVAGALTVEMVERMADKRIVFAMANPVPEIMPELVAGKVAVMATGRSDYPNQINNVLAFPGIFRGVLDCRAREITQGMLLDAARAISALIPPAECKPECIIPSAFDKRVAPAVAAAVTAAARREGVARA